MPATNKTKKRMKSLKSQAAIEFLTTYGWAFIVILVALGSLTYFGVVNPPSFVPNSCMLGTEFECLANSMLSASDGSGVVRLRVKNKLEKPVIISSWELSSESSSPFLCQTLPSSGLIGSGEIGEYEFSGCNFDQVGFVKGEKAKVLVKLNYYFTTSGSGFSRITQGEIMSTISSINGSYSFSGPQCSDNVDNDNNGCIDYAFGDTGCTSAADVTEAGGTCPNSNQNNLSLYCYVSSYCPDVELFHLSDFKDAHAEAVTSNNYQFKACCRTTNDTITNSCAAPDVVVLKLSNYTDAHVEKNTQSNYNLNVCITAPVKTVSCNYVAGACQPDETCLATISGDTDAHVGDCITAPFSNRVCCSIGG